MAKPEDKRDQWLKYNFLNPRESMHPEEKEKEVKKAWKKARTKYLRNKRKKEDWD